jgi:EAL domain-containing protein (putative c-di-GMP-specific phosphodiesterase class I)
MAHSLRLKVIAEGVEGSEQLAALRAQGCDEIQGYHLSRPLPADALEEFVRQRFAA